MNIKTIRISGIRDKILSISIEDVFSCLDSLEIGFSHWMITSFDAIVNETFPYGDVRIFESLVSESVTGLVLTDRKLRNILKGVEQGIDITMVGLWNPTQINLNADSELTLSSYIVKIGLLDSSFWEISSEDISLIDGFVEFFKNDSVELVSI